LDDEAAFFISRLRRSPGSAGPSTRPAASCCWKKRALEALNVLAPHPW